jgi:hypothetical protein
VWASRLTDIPSKHRVSAILARRRPVTVLMRVLPDDLGDEYGTRPRNRCDLDRNEDDSEGEDKDPSLCLLFVVALLDRVNIGFAALTMNRELAITSQEYGLIFGIFFFGYFFFEIPSNMLLHKIGARVWIARILITWGIVAMLRGFVHTVHQLNIARFLLGLAEQVICPEWPCT